VVLYGKKNRLVSAQGERFAVALNIYRLDP
jgi:hypothetical protein